MKEETKCICGLTLKQHNFNDSVPKIYYLCKEFKESHSHIESPKKVVRAQSEDNSDKVPIKDGCENHNVSSLVSFSTQQIVQNNTILWDKKWYRKEEVDKLLLIKNQDKLVLNGVIVLKNQEIKQLLEKQRDSDSEYRYIIDNQVRDFDSRLKALREEFPQKYNQQLLAFHEIRSIIDKNFGDKE